MAELWRSCCGPGSDAVGEGPSWLGGPSGALSLLRSGSELACSSCSCSCCAEPCGGAFGLRAAALSASCLKASSAPASSCSGLRPAGLPVDACSSSYLLSTTVSAYYDCWPLICATCLPHEQHCREAAHARIHMLASDPTLLITEHVYKTCNT